MTHNNMTQRQGGQVLVDGLRLNGVDRVFCVPGESFLPVLDALHDAQDTIETIVCRHEAAAAHMAEAHGKLTGQPGICIVTRGPGATHASIGVHTAMQDSSPMILLVGQVNRHMLGRDAWQEIDVPAVFGSLAKWAVQVDDAERLPELLNRAFQMALSGRPGPVVMALPEDLLYEQVTVADAGRCQRVQSHPGPEQLVRLQAMLAHAQRPFLLLGGNGWNAAACEAMHGFAHRFDLPVGTAFRRQDLFDNRDDHYAGDVGIGINPALAERIRHSDLVLAIGTRLGETTTSGDTLFDLPQPSQRMVHVHADAGELGRIYQAELMINSGVQEFAEALRDLPAQAPIGWQKWTWEAHTDYLATLTPPAPAMATQDVVDLGAFMVLLRKQLPADAIVTNGAGNYTSWVHRYHQYSGFRTQLAPTSGVMGYGIPAAIAAALAYRNRTVVCFAGDGCFQMSAQELATVTQYGLKILFVVVNNGIYGSIRMHQEINYPGKVHGTTLHNPDFAALAVAHGLHGETVHRTEDSAAALQRAMDAPGSALLELRTDPEAITPRTTLTALRGKALKAQRG